MPHLPPSVPCRWNSPPFPGVSCLLLPSGFCSYCSLFLEHAHPPLPFLSSLHVTSFRKSSLMPPGWNHLCSLIAPLLALLNLCNEHLTMSPLFTKSWHYTCCIPTSQLFNGPCSLPPSAVTAALPSARKAHNSHLIRAA